MAPPVTQPCKIYQLEIKISLPILMMKFIIMKKCIIYYPQVKTNTIPKISGPEQLHKSA